MFNEEFNCKWKLNFLKFLYNVSINDEICDSLIFFMKKLFKFKQNFE
jgi:hypothetical protein